MKLGGMAIAIVASMGLGACAERGQIANTKDGKAIDLRPTRPFRIINGSLIEDTDDFSRSIAGIYNLEDKTLCTGSVIHDNLILTAAHCMAKNPRHLRVFFGSSMEHILSTHRVIDVAVAPSYTGHRSTLADWGDVAIVKFNGHYPEGYKEAAFISEDEILPKGQLTLIAGFGVSDGTSGEGSGRLRKTTLAIDNFEFGSFEASLDQRQGTGACHGDSGGPAYIKTEQGYRLWGITSRGLNDPADDCSQFAVYSKVASYSDWITTAKAELISKDAVTYH